MAFPTEAGQFPLELGRELVHERLAAEENIPAAAQTSFGTPRLTEAPRAQRSPPVASGEPRRLLSSTPFQSPSGESRLRVEMNRDAG
jgi:hypothetical protein